MEFPYSSVGAVSLEIRMHGFAMPLGSVRIARDATLAHVRLAIDDQLSAKPGRAGSRPDVEALA